MSKIEINNLDELGPTTRKMFIALGMCCVNSIELGLGKIEFLTFCEGAWDTTQSNTPEKMKKFLQNEMLKDLKELSCRAENQEELDLPTQERAKE